MVVVKKRELDGGQKSSAVCEMGQWRVSVYNFDFNDLNTINQKKMTDQSLVQLRL